MIRRIVFSMALLGATANAAFAQQAMPQTSGKQPCHPVVMTKPVSEMPMAQQSNMPNSGVQQVAVKPTAMMPISLQLQTKTMPVTNDMQRMMAQSMKITNTSGQWFNYTGAATFSLMDKSGKVVETASLPEFRTQQNKMFKKRKMVAQPRSIAPNSTWEDTRQVTFNTQLKPVETYTVQCQVSGQTAKQELTYKPMPSAGQTAN